MERILVIDDDKFVRDSLALTLEWAGYAVAEAANAREGLAFHRENPASVVIADNLNADEEAWEDLRALRCHSPALPIISISGTVPSTDQESDRLRHILGVVYCLQKPFTVDELLSTIQMALPSLARS
ncbi:MAG: response regulator [Nitrospirales bacterium]|nr:response regulator [Nitrospira sp.]MDR4501454.1 response regulator [Nitrospirales bacterium]